MHASLDLNTLVEEMSFCVCSVTPLTGLPHGDAINALCAPAVSNCQQKNKENNFFSLKIFQTFFYFHRISNEEKMKFVIFFSAKIQL